MNEVYPTLDHAGAKAFADMFGLDLYKDLCPPNELNSAFLINGITIGIQTSRKAAYLYRDSGTPYPQILVLADYNDKTKSAKLVGWEWDSDVTDHPTREQVHFVHRNQLRPICELADTLGLRIAIFDK